MRNLNNNKNLHQVSERELARLAGISRTTLRHIKEGERNASLKTLKKIAQASHRELELFEYLKNSKADFRYSVPVVSLAVSQEGEDSWKLHFFNLIDEFLRTKDARLLITPPVRALNPRLQALISAIVLELCHRSEFSPPAWALDAAPLSQPWFVSGIESLKASAILESPARFKMKNVFILENFFERA
ncbi:MAG: XRE family transcriptional regulator [Bradymonadales bacterium]|nr:MAG: XRE family transcriptional regulator [Bradymonadales bacterium]